MLPSLYDWQTLQSADKLQLLAAIFQKVPINPIRYVFRSSAVVIAAFPLAGLAMQEMQS
jgi:hypothetical protein